MSALERGFRIAAGCAVAISAFWSVPSAAEPVVPASDDVVVEHLPEAGDRAAKAARQLRALLARAPDQIDLALKVAHDEIALGRAEGDPRHYGRAEAALAPWIRLPEPPPSVLLVRATLLQNRHDFDAALGDLDHLIALEPDDAQAILVRATVRTVRADYAHAADDCAALRSRAQAAVATTCRASVDGMTGHGGVALDALAQAATTMMGDNQPDLALWALTLTGEIAQRMGRVRDAETAFHAALGLGRRDVYLLGAYADFLLQRNRAAEVIDLLRSETRVDPLLLRLALAEKRMNAPETAEIWRCDSIPPGCAATRSTVGRRPGFNSTS
jgi:tetratricopeptide (TPR) repeat protein